MQWVFTSDPSLVLSAPASAAKLRFFPPHLFKYSPAESPEMIKGWKLFSLRLRDCSAYQICSLIEFPTHSLTSALMSP